MMKKSIAGPPSYAYQPFRVAHETVAMAPPPNDRREQRPEAVHDDELQGFNGLRGKIVLEQL